MQIIVAPDIRLTHVASNIKNIDKTIELTLDRMLNCMYENNGIGLAATQVGLSKRLVVIDCSSGDNKKNPIKFINPEVVELSESNIEFEEGCLSLPDQYANVIRPSFVVVKYRDIKGKLHKNKFEGLEGTCIQHEIDHLNGKLFVDHISKLRKQIIFKKLKKLKKLKSRI
jgi:peptide deformylase